MERSEPTLVPEWLKSSGSGNAVHHLSSSSSHSDEHALTLNTRNRSSVSNSEYDTSRSTFSDRSSSNFSRRNSYSNGSVQDKELSSYSRSYSSFSRSHRDRDWEKDPLDLRDKDRPVLVDYRDRDYIDPLSSIITSRTEKDTLKRSQSMISGKRGEGLLKRVAADSNSGNNISNGLLGGGSVVSSIRKAAFERDFPSLGAEERQVGTDIGRVSSPGLSTAVQNLPIATSSVIRGDGWTSALAEAPVIVASSSLGLSSVQQSAPVASSSVVSGTTTGLNMAETLAQAPARARTVPQLSVETQRLEELVIKQSRQLVPMTPSMPKNSALGSEKPKLKTSAVRAGDSGMATKVGQQQFSSSHLANHSLRGAAVRSDILKTSLSGKLLVLKVPREKNGVSLSPTAKEGLSPTQAGRVVNNPLAVAPATSAPPLKIPSNAKLGTAERKAPPSSVIHGSSVEKRPTTAQAQSRHDFFKSMRKKSSINLSAVVPDLSPSVPSFILDKSSDLIGETATMVSDQCNNASSSDPSAVGWSYENGGEGTNNGVASESQRFSNSGDKNSGVNDVVYPDEEEAAFLRSLGWEDNGGEDEGLTEEEINAFYENVKYMKLRPSSKVCRAKSRISSLECGSSGLNSSNTESEA